MGHAWFQGSASDLESAEKGFWWFVLRCERCESKRIDLISITSGDVETRRYEYPEGYEINETVTRSQLRLQWEQRRKVQQTSRRRAS